MVVTVRFDGDSLRVTLAILAHRSPPGSRGRDDEREQLRRGYCRSGASVSLAVVGLPGPGATATATEIPKDTLRSIMCDKRSARSLGGNRTISEFQVLVAIS